MPEPTASTASTPAEPTAVADILFNPLDPDTIVDPYAAYRRLREQRPVYWHEGLASWLLTRFDHCRAMLRDADRFTTDFRRIGIPTPPTLLSLQTVDPPDHTPLRHLVLNALRAQDLAALERQAAQRADALLQPFSDGAPFDLITDFADPFTLGTICDLFGVDPPPVDDTFHQRNDDLDQSMDSGIVADAKQPGADAREHFNALVRSWLAAPAGSGVIGYISGRRDNLDEGDQILVNSLRAFFHAGFEVPSRFLGNAVHALLQRPGALQQAVAGGPSPLAVEELLRFAGPVHALSRACTRETQIGDQVIPADDVVVALIGAANRDPARFTDPDDLDLARDEGEHLGFGKGVHSCMGQHVGRMEARVALTALTARTPALKQLDEPSYRPTATLRGLYRLPVAFG